MKLHLHQFLRNTGLFRNKQELIEAVESKKIRIDGQIISNPMYRFNPKKRKVFFNNKELELIDENIYILMNKPEGYLSTKLTELDKKLGKKSVFELLENDNNIKENIKHALICVGRLDEDTSGLLILTNDGKLGARITNPKHTIKKAYLVVLEKPITDEQISAIQKGVVIDVEVDGKDTKYRTRESTIKVKSTIEAEITITEGKKREIRKMFEAVGNNVKTLERVSIGSIHLKNLNVEKGSYISVDKKFIEERLKS